MATKQTIKNRIYREIKEMTSHIYRDDNWAAVSYVLKGIREALSRISDDLALSVSVIDGGYRASKDGVNRSKEYMLAIEQNGKSIIGGILTAHAAGSVADPFDRYDMTVVLW